MTFLTSEAQVHRNLTIAQPVAASSTSALRGNRTTHPTLPPPLVIIELAEGIRAQTSIPVANHSAVRSGFAGHPLNPRWTATKVVAWKTGREWRQGLLAGLLIVRSSDSMLVAATEVVSPEESIAPKHQGLFCFLPLRWFPQHDTRAQKPELSGV